MSRPWPRIAKRLALIIAATYVAVCALVWCFQAYLIYFPTRAHYATPDNVGLAYEDVTLRTADGLVLSAWYVPHPQPRAVLLFCHGNAGNIWHRLLDLKELHRLEFDVLIIDYRGFGKSEGRPSETGVYLDVQAAWSYLTKERGIPPGRIIVFGRSLGGAIAIELTRNLGENGPAALIVESSFTSLADVGRLHYRLLPVRLLLRHKYDSISKIAGITCPKLFMHGADDELIPLANGRRLFEAAAEPKTFIETPGGHNDAGFTHAPYVAARMAEFIYNAVEVDGR